MSDTSNSNSPALNEAQRDAVLHVSSPLLVLAGAGSGKTGVITRKIVHLIERRDHDPRSIIAVTFTNKAAAEMRSRVSALMSSNRSRGLMVCTFHRLGLEMLRRDGNEIGVKPGFTILDQHDVTLALRELLRESGAALEEKVLLHQISRWKSDFKSPEAALNEAEDNQQRTAAGLYARHDAWLRACNAVDFDDLITLPVRMLVEHPDVRAKWRGRLRHLLVDEYQDTNHAQYQLVRQLVDRFGVMTVVGDDDQSIYSWRGAAPQNLNQLGEDYPDLRVIKLEQNYRSSRIILHAANTLIANNPHLHQKRLWSALGAGENIVLSVLQDGREEAAWVAADIKTRLFQSAARGGDFAILYRSNFQARAFEQALRELELSYRISGGQSFFERAEIRDMLAYLRLLVNHDDDSAFLRAVNTPRREIGSTTLTRLGEHARERGKSLFACCDELSLASRVGERAAQRLREFSRFISLTAEHAERGDGAAVIRSLFNDIRYREWIEDQASTPQAAERQLLNVNELLGWIERLFNSHEDGEVRENSLQEVVARLSLQDLLSRNEDESHPEQINLMTLHAAKGLEFPHVFLVGLEEELLPHRNSQDEAAIEEERRLFYVGITRARRRLTLTRSRVRQSRGETYSCEPSRFIEELPAEHLDVIGEPSQRNPEREREAGLRALEQMRALLQGEN